MSKKTIKDSVKATLLRLVNNRWLYHKWTFPKDEDSVWDNLKLEGYAFLPRIPGFHRAKAAMWRNIYKMLEKSNVHPDGREWVIEHQEEEGIKWEGDAAGTRETRLHEVIFYERKPDSDKVEKVKLELSDINKDLLLVFTTAMASHSRKINKEMRFVEKDILGGAEVYSEGKRVVAIAEPLDYYPISTVETHEFNTKPHQYKSPRARILVEKVFGGLISEDGVSFDKEGKAGGARLSDKQVKENLRINIVGISRGGALFYKVFNTLRDAMVDLDYDETVIKDAMKQVFGLCIAPSCKIVQRDIAPTAVTTISKHDLVTRARVDMSPFIYDIKHKQYHCVKVDLDERQTVFASNMPKIVRDENGIPVFKASSGEIRFDLGGHNCQIYCNRCFAEFGHEPGYALRNALGAKDISDKEALFQPAYQTKYDKSNRVFKPPHKVKEREI